MRVLLLDDDVELDGLEVCRTIRTRPSAFRDIPIVAMTARADLTDRIVALESGIDDYVAKPVEMRELVARIGAVTRRLRDHTPYEDKTESDCNLALSEPSMSAIFGPFSVNLTELEMRIMRALAESRGTFLSRGEILENIGYDTRSDPAIVDTIIYRIRQKFRNEGLGNDFIKTQRGKGYSIRAELTQ